jgi:predicted lipoprotein with Yx(FWY)xxD motif
VRRQQEEASKGEGPGRRLAVAIVPGAVAAAALTAGWGPPVSARPAAAKTATTRSPRMAAGTMSTLAAASATTSSGPAPVYEVKTGVVRGLGRVLVDGQGFTLYVFAPDKRSGTSKCYDKCANAWPPLVLPNGVNQAPTGSGVRTALLGVTKRADGTIQVTYDKWPLYLWVVDSAPGDVTGQDLNNLGGKWYVITPQGRVITKRP